MLAPLRRFGKPVGDEIRAQDYVVVQSSSDSAAAAGRRYYNKAGFLSRFDEDLMIAYVEAMNSAPTGSFALSLQVSGGAIARKPVDATAFPNRDANYWLMVIAGWEDAAQDQRKIESMRAAWKLIEPRTSGFYINSMSESQYSQVASNFGANCPRLQRIKRKYDPANQFRLNANIEPA